MKKYYIIAAAAIMMAACTNEGNESPNMPNSNAIALSAQVADATTRAGVAVQSQCFETGEVINVECTPSGSTTATSYTYTTGEAAANVNALSPASGTHYWPASGTVTLKAFYPSTVTGGEGTFTVEDDQSDNDDYKASDLMYASLADVSQW